MAFFPRSCYTTADAGSFTPLFRLLDDFDSYSRQSNGNHNARRSALPQWQPKFDVRETGEAYELHGELPGMSKENVHIEFTEPQTMLIRGKVERTYTAGTTPTGQVEDSTKAAAIAETEEPKNNHHATVEDEAEASANESDTFEVVDKTEEKQVEEKKVEEKKARDGAKYWLTERSIGEFSRSFNFPSRVDQDSVSASFNNGILSISVPKAKKHESRRIAVL